MVKKPQSEGKEKDTTNQQCIVRRIGQWLVKKLTKGKKEEQIPTETLESESDAVCINTGEPPRLQILCQQVLSANVPKASARASTTTDNSVEPRNIDKTVADNVSPETDRNIVISLKELCIRVAHHADSTSMDINDSNQDLDIDDEQPTDNDLELDNDEYNQVTVMLLKDMCRQALTYPDDLEYNFDDFKTAHTDEQDNHDTNDPELDSASISSECHGNVLMTLIQLCTKVVVSNAEYKTTMDIDDIDKANNECYTPNGNLECDANKLMSLKDLCTTVVAASNAKTPGITDSENTGSKTTDISDNKQKLANDETQSKEPTEQTPKLTYKATEPEFDQITVLPLKEMCKAALIYPDNLEYNFNDFKTDYTDEQDNHDTNDPELDRASISSECHGNVLMTLIQLCTRVVVSTDDDRKTMDIDDIDKANNECNTPNGNLKCDANKLMSLKDLCTTVVAGANTETPGITDSENAGSKTTDNTDNKQKVANDETQPKEHTEETPKLTNKFTKPELDQVTVLSLKDMCKQALTYPDDLAYNFDDFKTDHTDEQDNHGINDPELDSASISSECHGNVLMTLIQLCTKVVVSNADDKKTMDIDDIDKANNECNTPNGNLKCDANKLMSLKDLCTTVVADANTETPGITDSENAGSETTGNTDYRQKVANEETQSKEPTEKTPKLINKVTKPEFDQITELSLKEICIAAVTYLGDLKNKTDATRAELIDNHDKNVRNYPELDNTSKDLELYGSLQMSLSQLCTKVVNNNNDKKTTDRENKDNINDDEKQKKNVNLECDRKLMSLKDICTETSIKPSSVDVFNTKKSPTDNAIQCNNTRLFSLTDLCSAAIRNKQSLKSDAGGSKTARQMHDKEFRISNDNRETILENRIRYEKNPTRTLKELCSTAIRNADMKTILKDIEKDYIFVEVANDMAENCETAQESVKHKSTSLRHERLAEGKNHEDNNTTLSEVNLATNTKQKSKDSENDKRDNKSQTDKMSVQSQVRMCLEEFKKAGKFYEYFRQRQGFKAGIKPCDDKSEAKFLKKRHKVSTNDAVDQKIGISYTKSDQDSDRQFTLKEDLSEIMIKNTKAIAMTLKELTKIDKGSTNEFNTGCGYIDDVMPVYDKTKLKFLTMNRPINEIILENDKAIAMTLKELSAAANDNADSLRTRTCDTKQVHVSKTDKLNKVESNTFDLLSGYDPNSPMSLKEIYLKAMRKTYDLNVDINNIEGDQAADKDRGGAEEIRSSLNKSSDMTDYLQKHYILTSALLSLMEMCDKESIQNKDEDIDQYMAKESDTKKECVKELLHLAEILNKLSEVTTKNIDGTNKNQEQANTNIRHYCKEIKKVNDAMGEKRATDSSKNTEDVNGKSQFRKTKGTHLGNDNSHGQTTVQATVLDIDETGQKNDDEYDHQNHADGIDINKIYKVTQAHYDDIGVNQINDIVKKESIDAKHVYVNSLQDTEKTNAGEMTKQNIEIKPTDKTQTQDQAAKKVNDRERDTGQNIMMTKINMTTGAAKAMADGTGIRPKDGETGRFETKKASEDESHDQLIIETYNDRKIKKKSRNKIKLQFEIDYHIDMDGKIIAAKLPENLHTLTDNEYTLPIVGEETIKRRKKKKIHSHYAGKAGKDSKRDYGARQSSHNQPEVKTEAKLKPISRCSGNENMIFAALYCDG